MVRILGSVKDWNQDVPNVRDAERVVKKNQAAAIARDRKNRNFLALTRAKFYDVNLRDCKCNLFQTFKRTFSAGLKIAGAAEFFALKARILSFDLYVPELSGLFGFALDVFFPVARVDCALARLSRLFVLSFVRARGFCVFLG